MKGWRMAPERDPHPLPSGRYGDVHVILPLDMDEGAWCVIKRCPERWMHNHPEDGDLAVTHGEYAALFTRDEWDDYDVRNAGMQRFLRRAHGAQ